VFTPSNSNLYQLVDSAIIEAKDVGVNFFFRSEDVGKVRSQVVAPRLRELNPLCTVSIIPTLTDSAILVILPEINFW
jgi:molybdopterin/thiamine biosynthesis adenylyltransferase